MIQKIKYTEIDTQLFSREGVDIDNYAITKLNCYIKQKQPFIHIDYDVLLLSKIKVDKDFTVGYYDFDFINNPVMLNQLNILEEYYIDDLRKLHSYIPSEIQQMIDFRLLPNFSIFGVNNVTLSNIIFKEVLHFYGSNKSIFNELSHSPSILEQFLFITYLRYYLDWQINIEDVISKVSNYMIEPREYITGKHQYARFLHLQGINKNSEFLNQLVTYLNGI